MSPEFREKLQRGYVDIIAWKKTLDMLATNDELPPDNKGDLPFTLRDGLLWKTANDAPDRLSIPSSWERDVFDPLHDRNHLGYSKLSTSITKYCMNRGHAKLREYLKTCSTCKVSKPRHTALTGISNRSYHQWNALLSHNWGIPKVVITERDPKFTAAIWQEMWKLAGTKPLYTTAYHPQTDEQSERMILWLESALRVAIAALETPAR